VFFNIFFEGKPFVAILIAHGTHGRSQEFVLRGGALVRPKRPILWGPGVLPPNFLREWGCKCARTSHFLVPCWHDDAVQGLQSIASFLPTVAELCTHADFCSTLNTNVDFIKLFDGINCIKMFGSGLCPDSLESPREEREDRRIEGGREVAWSGTPKIYDRSSPVVSTIASVNKQTYRQRDGQTDGHVSNRYDMTVS